jgi:hypothetical protein
MDFDKQWLETISLSRVSKGLPSISDPLLSHIKGKYTNTLLPALHFVAVVALMDEALGSVIEAAIGWPKKSKRDLYNKIEIVKRRFPIVKKSELHKIRERRNELSHEPLIAIRRPVSWDELEGAIFCIGNTLMLLGVISSLPQIEFFWKRDVQTYPDQLGPSGERLRYLYYIGVRVNGNEALIWKESVLCLPPTA